MFPAASTAMSSPYAAVRRHVGGMKVNARPPSARGVHVRIDIATFEPIAHRDAMKKAKPPSPLREAELLAQVQDAINATDGKGILHTWNAGAERIYGYSRSEVIGRHVNLLFFPKDRAVLKREVFEPLAVRDALEVTVRNRRKDGAEIFVALRLSVLRDRSGAISSIIGCSNDITERKKAEEALLLEIEERKR